MQFICANDESFIDFVKYNAMYTLLFEMCQVYHYGMPDSLCTGGVNQIISLFYL